MSVVATSITWEKNKIQSPSNNPNPSNISVTNGANTIYQRIGVGRVDILSSNGLLECAKEKSVPMNGNAQCGLECGIRLRNRKRIANLQSEGVSDRLLLLVDSIKGIENDLNWHSLRQP
jgi:hypothetical protein